MSTVSLAFAAIVYAFIGTSVVGVPSVLIYVLWLHFSGRVDDIVSDVEQLELERAA